MYLKSIEVQGFKSFANKISFEFHNGITGIVGPNGSGKSNVADAVRWVLGEQSAKQLRGSKMEDIIFAGTQLRKPQGSAFVSITLDNSDHKLPVEYDEVTVARRVYRSGESEYLINGNSCRLRDVQDLFLDTGIGKEGYSIIGQGQIDKILSGKPEERRELFDEAAGIVKYKKRKAAAEKQLEEEKLNLSRITDILSEIEKQIGPLEKQQATAREFLKYKEELKRFEVNSFLLEQEKQKENEKELSEKITIADNDLAETNQKYENSKNLFEKLEAELEELNEAVLVNQERKNEIQLEKKQRENDIRLLEEQISSIRASESHFKERKSAVSKERDEKLAELHKLQKDIAENDTQMLRFSEKQTELSELLEEIDGNINGFENEIENRNGDTYRLLEDNGTIKTNIQRYKTIREQNTIKKSSLTQKVLQNENEKTVSENEVAEGKRKLEEISERISEKLSQNREDETKLVSVRQELSAMREEYENCQREFIRQQSRAESLRNLSERYDGYSGGIRRVMELRDREKGILGVVSDIFSVEKKYETAIETALGGNIQNIVTDTEETAKRMIEFLKQNKAGRVTFLPLNAITAKNAQQDEVKRETGVIGYASELVQTQSRFQPIVAFLLGRIVVVDTIDHALSLAKKYKYSLRIVTLEGEQLNPGGSLSGGAYKNASNLLGRKREVDEAQEMVERLKDRLTNLEQMQGRLREERETVTARLNAAKETLQDDFLRQNTAKIELDRLIAKAQENSASYEEIHKELLEIESQDAELSTMISNLETDLQNNVEKSKHNESCIAECTKLLEEEKKKQLEIQKQAEDLRLQAGSISSKAEFLNENKKRIEGELSKLAGEESQLLGEGDNAQNAVSEKENAIETAKDMLVSLEETQKMLEKEGEAITKSREEKTSRQKSFLSEREELSEHKAELDKELYRLNDKLEKVREQMEEQATYMWEEYELTLSEAENLREDNFESLNQAKKRINELKNKIKGLGSVNVNAIEEYKEVSERFEFLSGQKKDLVEAGEKLTSMIGELDSQMRTQFEQKFAEIKDEFDVVFRELFGGGKGTLELQEEEDILTAGIRINAQPPGKKLQNMMQLSGGEKALTAIALLFAIQNLKPSPFCLLDEIEAALDDSNVKRYAGYLHKLTDNTQFIVITHRRGTMAAADTLYGITMQEKGVSTLVSVNLIEDKLDA